MLTVFVTIAIAFAGGVWALIKWGFGAVTDSIDGVAQGVTDRIDGVVDLVNVRFDAIDQRFEGLDKRVDGIDRRIDEMRLDLRAIVSRVDALQVSIVSAAPGPA